MFRLADRLILCPSRHALDGEGKSCRRIAFGDKTVEVWTQRTGPRRDGPPDLFVLKFAGAAGRAERSSDLPAAAWPEDSVEQWTPNPPGYGGSDGRASLQNLEPFAIAVYDELASAANCRPVIVTGNSLGCVAALRLAAERPVTGIVLRNPPPLRQVVMTRFARKTLWIGAWLVARQIPPALCSINNARQVTVPALFVVSERDSIVPPSCQQQVINAYAGEKRVMCLRGADHASLLDVRQQREYLSHLQWLRSRCFAAQPAP